MKIVYCIQGTYKSGGIERVLAGKANYFVGIGYEIIIITTDQRNRHSFFDFDSRVKFFDLDINYDLDDNLGRLKRITNLYNKQKKHKRALENILMQIHADIVISMFFQEASFLPSIKDGSKKILEMHTSKYAKVLMYPKSKKLLRFVGKIRMWQDERIAARYNRFIILTKEEKGKWNTLSNVEVIPNPVILKVDEPSSLNNHSVLAIGRYEYTKNFAEIIDIWAIISKNCPHWKLNIVGDGYLRNSLASQIQRLGLQNLVNLIEPTTDIVSWYKQSSVYVLTSHFEGLPMVLIEAQSVGLPIVSYSCPSGPIDIVSDGINGFLIEKGNKQKFANRLIALMNDNELRSNMGKAAKEASSRFSIDIIMPKWLKLFEQLNQN